MNVHAYRLGVAAVQHVKQCSNAEFNSLRASRGNGSKQTNRHGRSSIGTLTGRIGSCGLFLMQIRITVSRCAASFLHEFTLP
jgi:hypothetical protein